MIRERSSNPIRSLAPLLASVALVVLQACAGVAGAGAPAPERQSVFFAGVGQELAHYGVELTSGTLARRGAITLPGAAQYAWPHPSSRFLYVAWATGGPAASFGLSALRIDPVTGALAPHGDPVVLRWRPVHLSVDGAGEHVLIAYHNPSRVTSHRLNADGTIGGEVVPPEPVEAGVFAHQIRVTPSNRTAVLVARGNEPTERSPEDPGALKILDYDRGVLRNRETVAPGGGYGFQPRHVDFHPSRPWMYLAVERQHKLEMYRWTADDRIEPLPAYRKDTLDEPDNVRPEQMVGAIHVHPNGRFVYTSNRAYGTEEVAGARVFLGGENTIAVFSIDQETGEPTLVQNADTRGFHARTFSLDATGALLVAANTTTLDVWEDGALRTIPGNLAVFRVGNDGRLDYLRKYDVEPGRGTPFWTGFVTLP
jgi:6-phosphogluconolactonase